MKKRDLLFAGLLLFGATAFAQPQRTPQDPEQLFFQDFESDFDAWKEKEVDRITELQYYNNSQTGTKNNTKIWQNKADWDWNNAITRTDSVLILKNGVLTTDAASEVQNYAKDKYTILNDESQARKEAFDQFGEADKGGKYVFQYISDTCHNGSNAYSPNYRRNLFVRGLPIEDTTSYRLTFYVKATKVKSGALPRMYADVMRGYFHAEKPFSMGLEDDANNMKYKTTYSYEKRGWGEPTSDDPDPFTGEWEKVTFMTYYTNDSIANSFVFIDGYWWVDDWKWTKGSKEPVPTDHNLIYTVQPDKFFVRLSFSSDDTQFQVDNISLTKSTIGGVEYSGSKIRVDFGYKTNLGDLAKAAYAQNKIDAVEVQNEGLKYFTVWGKNSTGWSRIPIASAEYHGDGYMYMFAAEGSSGEPYSFDSYDSVLVSFNNPVDKPELCLKYTGDGKSSTSTFPRPWDTAWIRAGKIVPSFSNEVGKKNPYAVAGVFSMKELPPVVQETEYEENSFGIPSETKTIWIKFSRKIDFDNAGLNSTKLIAKLGEELLTPSWDAENSRLILTRTGSAPLTGDKELTLIQLKGIGTPEAKPLTFHYHFGHYTRFEPNSKSSDWRSEINIKEEDGLWRRPIPSSLYYWYASEGFFKGDGGNQYWTNSDGVKKRTSLGLYKMNADPKFGDCFFYLSGGALNTKGNLYTVETLTAGSYVLSFPAYGWGSTTRPVTTVKVYPAPALINTHESLDTLSGKMEIGKITSTNYSRAYGGDEPKSIDPSGYDDANLIWGDNTNIFEFPFKVETTGNYVIEWEITHSSGDTWRGIALGNYTITDAVDGLWFEPTNNLNKSVKAANAVVAAADAQASLYGGADLEALKALIEKDKIGGTFTSIKPSEWAAETKALDKAVSDFSGRMAELDKMKAAKDSVDRIVRAWNGKLEAGTLSYAEAIAGSRSYSAVDYTVLSLDSVKKSTDALNKLIKNFNDYRTEMANFTKNKAASYDLLTKYADKYAALAEYKAISETYELYIDYDTVGSQIDSLKYVIKQFSDANAALKGKFTSVKIYEMQIEALAELISGLDADVEVPEEVEQYDILLDDKVGFYMLYAQQALYTAIADGLLTEEDTLDVSSAFITNNALYTTMTSAQLGSKGLTNSNVIGSDGVNANNYPLGLEYFPGWKFTWKKGNPYIGGTSWGNSNCLATEGNISNAYLVLDWNTGVTMEQNIEALPAGNYTLGAGYGISPSANDGRFGVYEITEQDTLIAIADTVFYTDAGKGGTGKGTPTNNFITFETTTGVKLLLNPSCGNNGWNSFDNVTLQFNGPAQDFDYDNAIGDVEAAIELKTTVAPVKAAKVSKFYNLNGVEQTAPKAGLNIKVENGVATKVFVK